jgi:hypothetical protein
MAVEDPRVCQQEELNLGNGNKPGSDTTGTSLSEQLTRSDGVICPGIDSEMRAPNPERERKPGEGK